MRKRSEVKRPKEEVWESVPGADPITGKLPKKETIEKTSKRLDEEMKKAAREERDSTADLFESTNKGPPTKRRTQFDQIVEDVFDKGLDIASEYEYLKEALTIREDLGGLGAHNKYTNEAEDNARRSHKLYVIVQNELDRIKAENAPVRESMKQQALAELQDEKNAKKRNKAITKEDVEERAANLFADEWYDMQTRLNKAEGMVDHIKHLVANWTSRCYSANTMLTKAR